MEFHNTCDVSADKPPGPDNPLPEYGELYNKRQIRKANNLKTNVAAYEARLAEKRQMCMAEPLKDECIPKNILLPSKPLPELAGRYLEADAPDPASTANNFLKSVRVSKGPVDFPGWLIELTNPQLQSVVDARDLLASGKPLCDLLDPFYQAILGLDSGISFSEVKEIMRRVPITSRGWSFSHFMFIAGNPSYAKKKGVLQDPFLLDQKECAPKEDAKASDLKSKTSKSKKKARQEVVDRLYQLPKITKDDWPPKEDKKAAGDEPGGYSMRQKLFYSGLLYCEMYSTMQEIEKLYADGRNIPEPPAKLLKRQQKTGFGASNIGTRKLGFAEWDRPLPPLPKISPYITDFPVVGIRKKIVKPSGATYMYRRSITGVNPLYLAIKAPVNRKSAIKVLPNGSRVKGILDLLASQGNCLAFLPGVVSIFHLSDTLLQKMEDVGPQGWQKPPRLLRGNENQWIQKQAKNLFRPHGLPPQIAKIPSLITFSDGLKLREICKQVREQHWAYICLRKAQFRESIWPLMHVERIPCGNLRESFVYSFQTLLPSKSHLPIIRTDALPW